MTPEPRHADDDAALKRGLTRFVRGLLATVFLIVGVNLAAIEAPAVIGLMGASCLAVAVVLLIGP